MQIPKSLHFVIPKLDYDIIPNLSDIIITTNDQVATIIKLRFLTKTEQVSYRSQIYKCGIFGNLNINYLILDIQLH